MFRHLLIPLDGTSLAETVLPTAAELARRTGAQVTLLHVVERGAPSEVHGQPHLTDAARAETYLSGIAASRFDPATRVAWHVHTDGVRDVAQSLAGHAEEFAPDLVVLCAHGDQRLRDWFAGNIAQQVVKAGAPPVLLLRPHDGGGLSFVVPPSGGQLPGGAGSAQAPASQVEPALASPVEPARALEPCAPFRRILVPIDNRPGHERGIPLAETFAQVCGASVQLLTIVPTPETLKGAQAATAELLPESTRALLDMAEQDAAAFLARHLERLKSKGVEAGGCVDRGNVAERIAARAEAGGIDLIVLGTHGRVGTEAFWEGSLAQRLLRRIPLPFVLVPAQE